MAVYNHTRKLLDNKEVTLNNLKVVLTSGYTFDATQTLTTTATVGLLAFEVSGNGWTAGGEVIANVAVTTVATNGSMIDGDDISKTATGGAIGPADGYAVIDGTGDFPLAYTSFAEKTADDGTPFNVNFDADGIFRSLAPA